MEASSVESPEPQVERAAPDEWLRRFEIFRERYRLGLIGETRFKEISRAFQFNDDLGHIWMPGATSKQWYRWDRTTWTAATPPLELAASNMPIAIALTWNRQLVAPIELKANLGQTSAVPAQPEPPRVVPETRVPERIAKDTNLGQPRDVPLQPESPRVVPETRVPAPIAKDANLAQERSTPVQIETPPAEIKPALVVSTPTPPPTLELTRAICPHCGESYVAPAKFCPHCGNLIAGAPKKPARPTDLPERGATRSRSKPTDLPK